MEDYQKKGYLVSDFRVFRLKDAAPKPIPFHYHDFHKIILFLAGKVDYVIEGKTYALSPRDLIFVSAGEIHRPIFRESGTPYERIVIYISPDFFARWESRADLAACFREAKRSADVLHQMPGTTHDLLFQMERLERAERDKGFAASLYKELLFVEFMILVGRSILARELGADPFTSDAKIQRVLAYIGEHLAESLSMEELATKSYMSKSSLMHKFKKETGYTVHQYIKSKRLLLARDLLKTDMSVMEIAAAAGFGDYSTFSRAFKARFGKMPRELRSEG